MSYVGNTPTYNIQHSTYQLFFRLLAQEEHKFADLLYSGFVELQIHRSLKPERENLCFLLCCQSIAASAQCHALVHAVMKKMQNLLVDLHEN